MSTAKYYFNDMKKYDAKNIENQYPKRICCWISVAEYRTIRFFAGQQIIIKHGEVNNEKANE